MIKDIDYYIGVFKDLRRVCRSNLMYGYYSGVLDMLYQIRKKVLYINSYALEDMLLPFGVVECG